MANPTGKTVIFGIDKPNTTGTLVFTNITTHVNQASLQSAVSMLEDSALGDSNRTYLAGLAGLTFAVNGFWNTTTEGVYGPLIGVRTSVERTVQLGDTSNDQHYRGECLVSNVQVSGQADTLLTFSADHQMSGAVTRTSVQLT